MTPEFASPEQVRGEAITTATDVYSLGAMLFLALTGRLPYEVTRPLELLHRHTQVKQKRRPGPKPRDLVADLPPALDAICTHALAVDPARRVASASELLSALEAARPAPTPAPAAAPRAGTRAGRCCTAHGDGWRTGSD